MYCYKYFFITKCIIVNLYYLRLYSMTNITQISNLNYIIILYLQSNYKITIENEVFKEI
jgi:hypothetical protein